MEAWDLDFKVPGGVPAAFEILLKTDLLTHLIAGFERLAMSSKLWGYRGVHAAAEPKAAAGPLGQHTTGHQSESVVSVACPADAGATAGRPGRHTSRHQPESVASVACPGDAGAQSVASRV